MEKLGEFNQIQHQLEEQGSQVSNPVHKLLGKLPSSFESFTDNIYLRVPFPSYDEGVGLLHDKLLSQEANKPSNKSTNSAFMGNASSTSKGQQKGKKPIKTKETTSTKSKETCTFCGQNNHTKD